MLKLLCLQPMLTATNIYIFFFFIYGDMFQ